MSTRHNDNKVGALIRLFDRATGALVFGADHSRHTEGFTEFSINDTVANITEFHITCRNVTYTNFRDIPQREMTGWILVSRAMFLKFICFVCEENDFTSVLEYEKNYDQCYRM